MTISASQIEPGREIPKLIKIAKLNPPPGGYPWGSPHNEEYAKSIGFRGALVPGAKTLAYMLEMLVNFFGLAWMMGGKVAVKFIGGGVVDGEMVVCRGMVREKRTQNSTVVLVLDIWMENELGEKVIVGEASCSLPNLGS